MQDFRKLVDGILSVSVDTFGEEVTFYPQAGGVFKLRGVFDNNFQVVDVDAENEVSRNQPALGVNLNDVRFDLKIGDEVSIRGTRFRVQEKREDGQGGATCLLHAIKVKDAYKDTRTR